MYYWLYSIFCLFIDYYSFYYLKYLCCCHRCSYYVCCRDFVVVVVVVLGVVRLSSLSWWSYCCLLSAWPYSHRFAFAQGDCVVLSRGVPAMLQQGVRVDHASGSAPAVLCCFPNFMLGSGLPRALLLRNNECIPTSSGFKIQSEGRSNLVDPAEWPKIGLLNGAFGSILSVFPRKNSKLRVHWIFYQSDPRKFTLYRTLLKNCIRLSIELSMESYTKSYKSVF